MNKEGRPVLVGTVSVEKSERLAKMLERRGLKHNVLNAKQHEREAAIVAEAGQPSAVTIATNMAGRGTDIVLGEGVTDVGGLHIIGTERHESRRIDNQLRGRAGRQGDPGSSKFFISLEDDLMKIFGPAADRIGRLMDSLEVEPIEHPWVARSIASAQKKVEGHAFRRSQARRRVRRRDEQAAPDRLRGAPEGARGRRHTRTTSLVTCARSSSRASSSTARHATPRCGTSMAWSSTCRPICRSRPGSQIPDEALHQGP